MKHDYGMSLQRGKEQVDRDHHGLTKTGFFLKKKLVITWKINCKTKGDAIENPRVVWYGIRIMCVQNCSLCGYNMLS